MVKRIIWSLLAQKDRKNILEYWNKRNGTKIYSKKLNALIKEFLNIISSPPNLSGILRTSTTINIF